MLTHGHTYADFADTYSQTNLKDTKYLGFRDVPELLQKYVKGKKALDYGCGPGKSTALLTKLGYTVDGVDINEHMVDIAQKAFPENNVQVIRNSKIPAKDEQYDLVFASWVLQDIGPKDKLYAPFPEISRVLKKDGTFVAIVPSEAFFGRDWTDVSGEFEENRNLKSGDRAKVLFKENNYVISIYYWTENDYREVLREAGLEVVLVHKPLGRDDEGFAWMNEKEISPYTVYVAKKR